MKKRPLIIAILIFLSLIFVQVYSEAKIAIKPALEEVAPPPQLVAATNNPYTVKLGDTLSGIAYRHGMSLEQILTYNPHLRVNPDLILVGQQIKLGSVQYPPEPNKEIEEREQISYRSAVEELNLPNDIKPPVPNRPIAVMGGNCQSIEKDDEFRFLLPDNNFGYTLRDYPTFYWYHPAITEPPESGLVTVKFAVYDQINPETDQPTNLFYEASSPLQIPYRPGQITSLTLPIDSPPLKEGKEYQIQFIFTCGTEKVSLTGRITRISSEAAIYKQILGQLSTGNELENYPAILANNGVWYDLITYLAGLKEQESNNPNIQEDWAKVMEQIGAKNISNAPIYQSENN